MNCPQCKGELRFVSEYQRYFCDRCQIWPDVAPEGAPGAQQAATKLPAARAAFPYAIDGRFIPTVTLTLGQGQTVRVQPGVMIYRDPSVTMQSKAQGGLMKGLGRAMLGGESIFLVDYAGPGKMAISAGIPGEIFSVQLGGAPIRAKSGAFIACESNVEMETTTEKIGTAIIGGTGLFQLRFQGMGTVFLQAKGDVISGVLQPGQSLIADENAFLACDDTVTRNRERVQGMKNILTGGEGMYLLRMNGPGRYWLESGGGLIDWIKQAAVR